MSTSPCREPVEAVRDLRPSDLDDVIRIDSLHTGRLGGEYWSRVLGRFVGGRSSGRDGGKRGRRERDEMHVGLAATDGGEVVGYLLGEVRAFEFGSEPCGWVFAVGVESDHLRAGVASLLLEEARRRFRSAGIARIRTMVRRNDVPMLSFFRSAGFVGGSFVQLETEIEEEA